jgi:DNA replicative helicase MCM subunit Mcm2 (Cdc46/Mcm family)
LTFRPLQSDDSQSSNDIDFGYLSSLEYREIDEENGSNRTILINGVPDWAIRLKRNRYYSLKAVESLVCGCCDRNNLDYVSLQNVAKCVQEIMLKINGYDNGDNEDIDNSSRVLSVSNALRKHSGKVRTLAMIVGVSQPYKVVTNLEWTCQECGYQDFDELDPPPQFLTPPRKKCPKCRLGGNDDKSGDQQNQVQPQKYKQKQIDLIDLIALPQYKNAKSITVQDSESYDDLEKLHVVLLGDRMTRNVKAGGLAVITGSIHVLNSSGGGRGSGGSKLFPVVYAESMEYQSEEDKPITDKDIEAFKRFAEKPDLINRLISMFAQNVIGHSDKKLGLLRSAVNSKSDVRANGTGSIRNRTHTLLIGDPGVAKSMLAKEVTNIVPNSRYVTAQHASPKSLLAIVDKEQDNSKMLLLGAVPMSKNAICSINELGSKAYEDQQYLADVMEEGRFTIDKYGIYQEIDSPTTIIATSNPNGGYWSDKLNPHVDEIPIRSNILDRIDQIYIFKDFQTTEERREYAKQKMLMNQKDMGHNYNFLRRYILYAASSLKEPILTAEASSMLTEFWIRLGNEGYRANRSLDSLVRIAKAQARLHLKEEVDVQIVNEVIQNVGLMFVEFGKAVDTAVADPRDLAYNEVIEYVNRFDYPITFIEAVKHVCEHNNAIKQYLGDRLQSIGENKKLRALHDRFTDRAIGNNNKRSRSGLTVVIKNMSPLVLVKAGKQEREQPKESQQEEVLEELDRSNRSNRSIEPSQGHQSQLTEVMEKAMLDSDGTTNRGYFTLHDLSFWLMTLPNQHWTEDSTKEQIDKWLQEGKIEEIESGKYSLKKEKPK